MNPLGRRILVALALAVLALPALAKPAQVVVVQSAAGHMTLGDPKAPIEVVEYASLTCPHCARFHADVYGPFKAKYVDTGKVRFTLKEALTAPAQVAVAGFLVARCAGKDKYFTVVDGLFDSQAEMFGEAGPLPVLIRVGASAGLTEPQVRACIADRVAANTIYDRAEESLAADKIEGTPTILVNGKIVGVGEISLKQLDTAIAAARKTRR